MSAPGGVLGRLGRLARLLADPRTPKLPKLAVGLALVYALWPLDLVPDFPMPLIGYLDDLVVVWAALRWLAGRADADADGAEGAPAASGPADRTTPPRADP